MVELNVKILTLGDTEVGKTSIIKRIISNKFEDKIFSTVGIDYSCKTIKYGDNYLKIFLWDTAGQEKFKNIVKNYFNGANGALLCFDISNRKSFENTKQWIMDCKNYMAQKVTIILVGNKCDLEEQRKISKEEGQELADAYGLLFFETSAKTDVNVNTVFNTSLEEIARRIDENYYDLNDETCGIKKWVNLKTQSFITVSSVGKKKKSCC